MKRERTSSALVALVFTVSLALPQAMANPSVGGPLQAAESTTASQGACFGYNNVNDSMIPRVISSLRIAVVQPILTSTPYSQYDYGSFYAFYAKESGVTSNVTTNLDLLSTNVSSGDGYNKGWGLSYGMYEFLTSQTAVDCGLTLGRNLQVLTDMDVANGALFNAQNHTARFDVVILPFSEYVEAQEYLAYEGFVAGGGTLVLMAHSLEYPVTYNATSNVETLVYGHGWAFNGKYAYPVACASNTYITTCPWAKNNTDWIGSNTCEAGCFHTFKYNGSVVNTDGVIGKALYDEFGGTVFKSYLAHEEDTITNMTATSIVSVFLNNSNYLIAAYTHQFRKGTVVGFGFFGDDIIATDPSAQYFLLMGIVSNRLSPTSIGSSSVLTTSSMLSSTTTKSTPEQLSTQTATVAQSQGDQGRSLVTLGLLSTIVVVLVLIGGALLVVRRRQAKPAP